MKNIFNKSLSMIFMLLISNALVFSNLNCLNQSQKEKMDSLFSKWNTNNSTGFAIGIVKDNQFVFKQNYGMADVENQLPVTDATSFQMASITKQFTAASVVLLSEQGKLSLEDTIDKYFPNYPSYTKTITIRHLLNHTGGFRSSDALSYIQGYNWGDYLRDTQIDSLLAMQQELNFVPGDHFEYSNTGYWLLSQIVQKVSGVPLYTFVKENILKPLEMTSSYFVEDPSYNKNTIAKGYTSKKKPVDSARIYLFPGSSGLVTTVADFKKWDENFYSSKIGGSQFVQTMETKGIFNNGIISDYALGLQLGQYNKRDYIRHGGGIYGFRTNYCRFPKEKVSFIIFCNSELDIENKLFEVIDIYFEESNSQTVKSAFPISEKAMKKYCGRYFGKEASSPKQIFIEDKKLFYFNESAVEDVQLIPTKANEFKFKYLNDERTLVFNPKNKKQMTFKIDNKENSNTYYQYNPTKISKKVLRSLVGKYYCPELNKIYEMRLIDGQLVSCQASIDG